MRLLGINLPDTKRIDIGLTSLYGVGRPRAHSILDKAGVPYGVRVADLSRDQENEVRKVIEGLKLEGDLRREIASNIKRLKDVKAYRGIRHIRRLPVRGQRTKTNSRTVHGNVRKTMGSGRKKVEKK